MVETTRDNLPLLEQFLDDFNVIMTTYRILIATFNVNLVLPSHAKPVFNHVKDGEQG